MHDVQDSPVPATKPEQHSQIEIDTFCTNCFYNLHGQRVMIDERLQLPVCRCPECGKFHAAGSGVTASTVWIRRAATMLMFSWIISVVAGTLAGLFAMGGLSAGSVETYTVGYWINNNTNQPANLSVTGLGKGVHYVNRLRPYSTDIDENSPGYTPVVILSAGSLLLGLLGGALYVSLMWHWPRYRYYLLALLPVIPATFLFAIYTMVDEYQLIRQSCYARVGFQFGLQVVGVIIGVIVGRSVARVLISIIIPPKTRQALSFLWRVDGKKLPIAASV